MSAHAAASLALCLKTLALIVIYKLAERVSSYLRIHFLFPAGTGILLLLQRADRLWGAVISLPIGNGSPFRGVYCSLNLTTQVCRFFCGATVQRRPGRLILEVSRLGTMAHDSRSSL